MSWSPQQEQAIKSVKAWLADKSGPQIFRLFGYAGTGKTTIAKELAKDVKGNVLFAAFTGKAALRLRQKGCHNAGTIHGLIYKPFQDAVTGEIYFALNADSDVASAALTIIDEVSMVGEDLAADLMSYGTRVLVLGDPEQLPPVKGEGFFINATPDVMLTEIHRQAAENPIIRMSMDVREGGRLRPGRYGDSQVILRSSIDREAMREIVMGADQVLCGLNATRQAFNARVRQLKGLAGPEADYLPVVNDRLVCLKNDKEKGLLNGGLWEIISREGLIGRNMHMRVRSLDDDASAPVDVVVPQPFFNGSEKSLSWKELRGYEQFTYGYALTCHKAQGSEWPHPVVFDESRVFREDASKWLYTAVTRAANRITVVLS